MSKTAPIPFKDINFDHAAAAAQHVTEAHNIPSLAFPQGRGGLAVASPLPTQRAPEPVSARTPTKTLKVAVPLSAVAEIKQRMIDEEVTQQFILLKALQKGGIPIDDADIMEDGRRDR